MRSLRRGLIVAVLSLLSATLVAGTGPVSAQSSGGGGIWVQTMDSCKQALGGSTYVLSGGGVSATATVPASGPAAVGPSSGCPLQQGSCSGTARGCVSFAVPAPGTYTLRQTATPPGNSTNPEGYAPCEGGSACRSEVATLTVAPGGGVRATVTNVYPDGTTMTWPSNGAYAASAANPIVFHDFGLAAPGSGSNSQCDGDSDADDHLTGTPSSHCAFPESEESTACQPFPWSCQLTGGAPTGAVAGPPAPSSTGASAGEARRGGSGGGGRGHGSRTSRRSFRSS
jgi:hypothetical protein